MNPNHEKKSRILNALPVFILLALLLSFGCAGKSGKDSFRFVFMTDIHLTTKHNAVEGFRAAIRSVNEMKPRQDFVITGGDLILDALDQNFDRADSLYTLYQKISAELLMPVHNKIGNNKCFV